MMPVKFADLTVHPAQMRTTIDRTGIARLTQQILASGLDPHRPIVVNRQNQVVSGHRRWLAAMLAVLVGREFSGDPTREEIEQVVGRVQAAVGGNLADAYDYLKDQCGDEEIEVARFEGDAQAEILALQSANFGQQEADPKGLARTFYAAIEAGIPPSRIAANIGRSVRFVKNHLALHSLPAELVDLIVAGRLAMGIAPLIAALPSDKREALARVVAVRSQTATPPTLQAVKEAAARLKAFDGFRVPMTTDPALRNRARVLAAAWQLALEKTPKRAWVAVADAAYLNILEAPWTDEDKTLAFIHAFDGQMVVGGRVDWTAAMQKYVPDAACTGCVFAQLPDRRLNHEPNLPCRRQEEEKPEVCPYWTQEPTFTLPVPWDWAGLEGVSEETPYRVTSLTDLLRAWHAREAAEVESEGESGHKPQTTSPAAASSPAPVAGSDEKESPIRKMRDLIRDFMAHHEELAGADHPLATRCAACRHKPYCRKREFQTNRLFFRHSRYTIIIFEF